MYDATHPACSPQGERDTPNLSSLKLTQQFQINLSTFDTFKLIVELYPHSTISPALNWREPCGLSH